MFRYSGRGFTLIELLVVIAIIGILSSGVLASLNTARIRGKDASIRSQMAQIRSQASIFYSTNGSYTLSGNGGGEDSFNECLVPTIGSFIAIFPGTMMDPAVPGNINSLVASAAANRNLAGNARIHCEARPNSWAFAIPTHNPSAGMTGWCVDSQGAAKEVSVSFQDGGRPLYSSSEGLARCP